MSSLVAKSWAYINGDDDSNGIEISNFNSALLLSLMEDTQGEEYNDEQLNRVIQSLEAEINANMLEAGHHLAMETAFLDADDKAMENCSASMECYEWAEMEMAPSSPTDEMNWYMEYCGNELDAMVEYVHVSDYSQIYNVFSSEEHGLIGHLRQETYDTVAYN